jgi:hydroxymethylbilane synthase
MPTIVVGTRGSALARRQTARVIELLESAWPGLACEERPIVTRGDRTQRSGEPLPEIGGKGLFTAELEQGLRAGELDLAVHSLKDLPTEDPLDVVIGAVCAREDVRDCLVSRERVGLGDLPDGAVVGTSSLRRAAQLRALRPRLDIRSIRGNVDTRIRKVREGEYDAALLAAAGIRRLGLEAEVTEWLSPDSMLPAPGQGALAVQCRAADERVLELLAAIDDTDARATTLAERTFLRALQAGCTAPVGAHAVVYHEASDTLSQGTKSVLLGAIVLSPDGKRVVRVEGRGEPEAVGERLAREALAGGADEILAAVRSDRPPLQGRRIVVTRPHAQARALADELERHGATAVLVPLVAIEPVEQSAALRDAVRNLAGYDWVVFTSANGVSALRDLEPDLEEVRVAAVGPATAAAVRELGAEPEFVPERFSAEELASGIGSLDGTRVLLPQADIADPHLASALRAGGAHVDVIAAYRTVAVEPSGAELAALAQGADAIVLASGSAARGLKALAESSSAVSEALARSLLVSIGPKTAEAVREAGLPEGIVADEATAEGIIHALSSHFGGGEA